MIVLKIIGIVLAVIILLITIILLLPVDIIIKKDNESEKTKLLFRFLFMTFGEEPSSNNKENKLVKSLLSITGVSKLTDVDSIKENADSKGVSATVSDTISIITKLIKQILWIFKFIKLRKLYINCICAGEDAAETAMDYGVACATIYPLSGYLHSIVKVKKRKEKVVIQCDFNRTEPFFTVDAVISVRIVFVVFAFLKLVKEETEKKLQEMN